MKCNRCEKQIESGEAHAHLGQVLCEDCCMDVLSPSKACDPWAVHSAKSFEREQGGQVTLSAVQKQILDELQETGGLEPTSLAARLALKPAELERELATLRHMEKTRAELRHGKKYVRLW